jgi:Flp pilus assembly protein TadD
LELNPTDAYRRSLLAYWLAALDRPKEAQSELQQALASTADNAEILFQSAIVNELNGRRAAAEKAYRAAIRHGYPRPLAELHPDLRAISRPREP